MKQSIRIGRIGGIPVGVNWSVAVIFGLVTWELGAVVFPRAYGAGEHTSYWVAAVTAAVLFFASLLVHEGSHALLARRNGVGVRSITLWLFGGVAQLEGEAFTPGADFKIAAAGPGASIALAGIFGAAQFVLQHVGVNGLVVDVPSWLWQINLLLAGFNLIPAAPLDGGRILRAALWRATHDRARASVMAARAGLGFGGVLIALGAVEFVLGSPLGLWPAFMGWFLLSAARAEQAAAEMRRRVDGLTVAEVMVPHPPTVPSGLTMAELFAGQWPWWRAGEAAVVVAPTGWMEGVVTVDRLQAVPVDRHHVTRLVEVAVPITDAPVARPDELVTDVMNRIYASGGVPAVVLDPNNRLAGVVTLGDVERATAFSPGRSRAA